MLNMTVSCGSSYHGNIEIFFEVFLMTVTSGIPPTDNTPILSIYYATVMVLTTAATVLGVIVLRIHHQGRRGLPVPPYLRRLGK